MASENNRNTDKISVDENAIIEAIKAMVSEFDVEDGTRYKGVVDGIQAKYGKYDMNPEAFSALITFDIAEKLNHQAARRFFPQYAGNRGIMFIVEHYRFISAHLSKLVDVGHGHSACCADCSRWIIGEYIKHMHDVNYIPDMSIDEHCFWKPRFGSGVDWMAMCGAIERLYWGQPDEYIATRTKLLQQHDNGRFQLKPEGEGQCGNS